MYGICDHWCAHGDSVIATYITKFGTNSGPTIPKVSIVLEDALRLGFSSILPNSGGKIVGSRASDGLVGTTGHRNHQKRSLDNVSGL